MREEGEGEGERKESEDGGSDLFPATSSLVIVWPLMLWQPICRVKGHKGASRSEDTSYWERFVMVWRRRE